MRKGARNRRKKTLGVDATKIDSSCPHRKGNFVPLRFDTDMARRASDQGGSAVTMGNAKAKLEHVPIPKSVRSIHKSTVGKKGSSSTTNRHVADNRRRGGLARGRQEVNATTSCKRSTNSGSLRRRTYLPDGFVTYVYAVKKQGRQSHNNNVPAPFPHDRSRRGFRRATKKPSPYCDTAPLGWNYRDDV